MRPNGQQNNNNGNLSGNPGFYLQRGRLLSMNTPKLSPLRIAQSPFPIAEPNFLDSSMGIGNEFRLEEPQPNQENVEPVQESEEESYSEMEFAEFPENQEVTKENMIEFLVATININEDRIHKVREEMERSGQTFLAEVFQYLYKRFKKTKKTKEEMIKYTMRKSFKFITDQMKKDDPSLIPVLSTDGIEGMSIYFTKNSNDKDISIPFKKNSAEKTMNTAFLKSVFSVKQFTKDYKKFLKTFQNEFIKDNTKKVNSMTDAVKASISSKNYKSLQNYKRIPWTTDILSKLKSFAVELLNYSPYKAGGHQSESEQKQAKPRREDSMERAKDQSFGGECHNQKERKTSFQLHTEYYNHSGKQEDEQKHSQMGHRRLSCDDHFKDFINDEQEHDLVDEITKKEKKPKKKSVIILTPPMMPMNNPPSIPDYEDPLD